MTITGVAVFTIKFSGKEMFPLTFNTATVDHSCKQDFPESKTSRVSLSQEK